MIKVLKEALKLEVLSGCKAGKKKRTVTIVVKFGEETRNVKRSLILYLKVAKWMS